MKVAIYTRVSTNDQTNDNQLIELRKFCQNNNYEIVKEYSDTISGTKSSRPELDKMLKAMREKKFEAVVIWKIDRLGRSMSHGVQILEEMKNKGVRLIVSSQNFDSETPIGKMVLTFLFAFAEMEREMIIERINLGLSRARAEGIILGRPRGSRDGKRRKKSGYYLRWQKKPAFA